MDLPEKAVDGYELRWFTRGAYGIAEHRAVYHVNTPWAEAEQATDYDGSGIDFIDHWQYFTNGHFIGRSGQGWKAVLALVPDEPLTNREEAKSAVRVDLRRRIRSLKRELADVQKRLRAV